MQADFTTMIPPARLRALLGELAAGLPNPLVVQLINPQTRPRQFVRVVYAPGEVITPKGIYGDYAALLVHGKVEAYNRPAEFDSNQRSLQPCWRRPGRLRRWFEDFVLDHTDRPRRSLARLGSEGADPRIRKAGRLKLALARWLRRRFSGYFDRLQFGRDPLEMAFDPADKAYVAEKRTRNADGSVKPPVERLMGVTAAMWNLRRSVTLVARTDPADLDDNRQPYPCELLLIHRRALLEINERNEAFRTHRARQFFERKLPRLLSDNRLFRDKFHVEDVRDWPRLLARLQGKDRPPRSTGLGRLRQQFPSAFLDWLTAVDASRFADDDQQRVVSRLNNLLKESDLFDGGVWPIKGLDNEARAFAVRGTGQLTQNELIRFNRLLLHHALGDALQEAQPFRPDSPDDFAPFVQFLQGLGLSDRELLHYKKGEFLYRAGTPADGLFLLVSGKVRVARSVAGQELLVNQLEEYGFLGVSCVEAGARHSASVEAVTDADAVKLPSSLIAGLEASPYASVLEKLRHERSRQLRRMRQWGEAQAAPPVDPPERIASRLMVGTNLLVIDMDRCTRCDECVRACASAHEGVSRFRRANPELRFNRWEVTRACLHCSDAPCQKVCPVGAITFHENDLVQIHRSRCIGCTYCEAACPFDAIEMLKPLSLDDAGQVNSETGIPRPIANKCDLCLDTAHEPPCVHSCPYDAAHRGSVRKLFPGIKTWDADQFAQG